MRLSKTYIVLKNHFNIYVYIAYEKSWVVLVSSDREEILSGYFRDSHLGEHGAVRGAQEPVLTSGHHLVYSSTLTSTLAYNSVPASLHLSVCCFFLLPLWINPYSLFNLLIVSFHSRLFCPKTSLLTAPSASSLSCHHFPRENSDHCGQ